MAILIWIAIFTIVRVTGSDPDKDKQKLQNDLSNIKDQLDKMQGGTDDLKESLDALSTGLDKYIKKEDDADVYDRKLEKAKAVVEGTLTAIPKFTSGDPAQIISGVLDMTSMALANFGGPYGAAAAMFLNVVSSLIEFFMVTPKSTPTLEQAMRATLEEFHDEELYEKMNTFVATLAKVHHGIVASRNESKDIEGNDLSDDDITQLKTEIDLFSTDTLLEDVKKSIRNEIRSEKVHDAERAIKTLNVYCQLSIVVELVLIEFINYIKAEQTGSSSLPAYYRAFMEKKRDQDKVYLEFLHLPTLNEALIAAIYQKHPGKHPELRQYVKAINVVPIPVLPLKEGKTIYLSPKEWPDWYFYLSSESHSLIYGSTGTNKQSEFVLKNASNGEVGREWLIQSAKYQDYFISARKFEGCCPTRNHHEIAHVEGLTMSYINNIKRKCPSLCRVNRKCDGCYNNCYSTFKIRGFRNLVSINYVWRFTKLKSSGRCSYYFISATHQQFGPGYTLFMKGSANGNAYLRYGNPKKKGMFKLVKKKCE